MIVWSKTFRPLDCLDGGITDFLRTIHVRFICVVIDQIEGMHELAAAPQGVCSTMTNSRIEPRIDHAELT